MRSPADFARPQTIGLLLLVATSLGWGANWPILKQLLHELPPLTARGWSGLAAAAGLLLLARLTGERILVPRAMLGRLLAAACLNVMGWMGFATIGLWWLNATEGAIIAYTMPVWAALIAWPVLGEKPSVARLAGLALGLAGVVVVLGTQGVDIGLAKLPGAALILVGSIMFALGTCVTKRWPLELAPMTATGWQIGLGCVPLLLLSFPVEDAHLGGLSAQGWGAMAYMAAGPLCLCYLAWFEALKRLPASVATIGTLLAPVAGVLLSAAWLGEPLGLRELGALVLTLGGVLLAVLG
jgi:drug/metabolite transporter (DMT)-like permease